jgi:hypothetical protein
MEILKEILSDKVDYLNALRNAPLVQAAPPPIIEIAETVIHTPVITEMPTPPPVTVNLAPIPVKKKGIKLWHVLLGAAAFGLIIHFRNKRKKQKDQDKFNGWR